MSSAARCRRVVITGVGVVSPIGRTAAEFRSALSAGRCAIRKESGSAEEQPIGVTFTGRCEFSGTIDEFGECAPETRKRLRKSLKLMNRETQLGVAAGQQALADSGLSSAVPDPLRTGVCFGAGNVSVMPEDFVEGIEACQGVAGFEFRRWGECGIPQVEPLWILKCLPNMPACHLAICNDLQGPNNSITQREAAANLALAEAAQLILDDEADVMLTGGTGTLLEPFNRLHAIFEGNAAPSGNPEGPVGPFDRRGGSLVIAEGAAALVLEERAHALRRGVPIYGEVTGFGSSCVVSSHRSPDLHRAAINAMRSTLRMSGADKDSVGHVHAHGHGARSSDTAEALAIRAVFKHHADRLPVTAVRSYMGNSGAGGGAIELVASLLALRQGTLFRIVNCDEPDDGCPIHPVITDGVPAGDSFINLNLHPQGLASCVMIRAAA